MSDLAEALGIEPASVRVKLRKLGVEKSGRSYGWNTKKELDEVVKQCKADAAAAPKGKADADDEDDEDEAPKSKKAKKGKAKAAA